MNGKFASQYRSRQILDMLHAGGNKLKPEDGLRIQKDVYSGFNLFLARQVVAAYEKRGSANAQLDSAVALLKAWNGQMDQDLPQPFITQLIFQYVRKAAAERAAPGSGAAYEGDGASLSFKRCGAVAQGAPTELFIDYNQTLLRCFADAIDEGSRIQGKDPTKWRWGKYMFLEVNHPVGSRIPVVGKYFNIGPVPMSGGGNTVKQTGRKLGPSERMDALVGNWDDSLLEIPIGESGHFRFRALS